MKDGVEAVMEEVRWRAVLEHGVGAGGWQVFDDRDIIWRKL